MPQRTPPLRPCIRRLVLLLLLAAALLPGRAAVADEFGNKANASSWTFTWGGYVHVAWRWIQQPDNYNLAGRNNGFQLEQARLGLNVQYGDTLAARVSIEGASEDRLTQSFPGGTLTPRLRDAYITWAPLRAARLSMGQLVTPWDLESMRSDSELPFVTRAVPVEGVQPHEGRATLGLGADRNIGLSIHSGDIGIGSMLSGRYALFVGNGNGQNKLLNDNNLPAFFGRFELAFWGSQGLPPDRIGPMRSPIDGSRRPIVTVGGAFQYNPRTVGNPPDLINETDVGGTVDAAFALYGIEVQGGFLMLKTTHDTLAATPDLERAGWWAQARYTIPKIPVEITPGYRIASYAPRSHLTTAAPTSPMDAQIDDDLTLLYHTFGVSVRPTHTFPMHLTINYTVTGERSANSISNDRFELDAAAVF